MTTRAQVKPCKRLPGLAYTRSCRGSSGAGIASRRETWKAAAETARRRMDTSSDREEAAMRNLLMTTVISIVSVVSTQAFAGDVEDYTGLPVYQEDIVASHQEVVIDKEHTGYDGLPVTRRTNPVLQYVEIEAQEGYDGVPLVGTESHDMFAIQE
jgi:hypothetical protein